MFGVKKGGTYVWGFLFYARIQQVVQHVDVRFGFDGYPGPQALRVDIPYQLPRTCLVAALRLGRFCGGGEGGFVVETVEIRACGCEFFHPLLWLLRESARISDIHHLFFIPSAPRPPTLLILIIILFPPRP